MGEELDLSDVTGNQSHGRSSEGKQIDEEDEDDFRDAYEIHRCGHCGKAFSDSATIVGRHWDECDEAP